MIKFSVSRVLLLLAFIPLFFSCAENKEISVTVLATTDIHGVILPYDYTDGSEMNASLASVSGYLKEHFKERSSLLLLDNGDNLQGQPSVYYYNFVDTVSKHILSEAFNYLKYDAISVGNHDIETGHAVYDRIRKEYNFEMLAANAVDTRTGEPYFKPYEVFRKNGVKIVVLGLVTPYIPNWLPPQLYSGISFADMTETAAKWMKVIDSEDPDIVIGLFHSGWDRDLLTERNRINDENASASVAYNVPGFDIIITGHDHSLANEKIVNIAGDTVLVLDGGSGARNLMRADITISRKPGKGKMIIDLKGAIIDLKEIKPDIDFINAFSESDKAIKKYTERVIGNAGTDLTTRESYFGPSRFMSMLHSLQLEISGADISFAAPLSFDAVIHGGNVTVGDMFRLYRYENMLYTMNLTGAEIKSYLEYSYSLWLNTMKSKSDNLLLFRKDERGKTILVEGRARLLNPPYNFDSAAGIEYTVDVSQEPGSRITIASFSDGRSFEADKMYKVAVNSYRGSGGGGHLTRGSGLSPEDIQKRLVYSTVRDLRYYLIEITEKRKTIGDSSLNNWTIKPSDWVENARTKDYNLLFNR